MKFITPAIIMLLLVLSCCSKDKNTSQNEEVKKTSISIKKQNTENLNISFLLDLSDRINPEKYPNPAMDFYKRDAAYIKSVAQAFDMHLRKKKVKDLNDKIQVFFDPEPLDREINSLSNSLKIEITKKNASLELLDSIQKIYAEKPEEIYNLAIKDNNYLGSNTWKFFKNKAEGYCIESNYRNILVILTDGYIYHENSKIKEANLTTYLTPQNVRKFKLGSSNWKERIEKQNFGFIPATENLSDLEILVLGINPDHKNPYEEDVIKTYWSNWFVSMGVKRFEIKNADLPSNMDKLIKEFILTN